MYKKITIKGLRGIKHLEIDDFQQVNLFVGKNNCGKTTILEALFLLIAPSNPVLPLKINTFRDYKTINESTWRLFFNKLDINSNVRLVSELENPKEKRNLIIKPDTKTVANVTKTASDRKLIDITDSYSGPTQFVDGLILEYTLTKGDKKHKKITTKVIVKNQGIETIVSKDHKELMDGVFFGSSTIYFKDMGERFDNIQIRKQTDRIIKVLKRIEPSLDKLSLGVDGRVYCDVGLDRLLPINVMGDGMFRLLGIIMAIMDSENGIVLIDEIENGFYYSSQEIVWDAVFETAKEFNVQVFATTHSIECVKAFSSAYSKRGNKEDNLRLYRIERDIDEFRAVMYNHKILEASLDSDWEVR